MSGEGDFIVPTRRDRWIAGARVLGAYALLLGFVLALRFYAASVGALPMCEQVPWAAAYLVAFLGLLIAGAAVAAHRGWRAWSSGQFPPPGHKVLFRTRIHRGAWARLQAIACFALSAALLWVAGFVFLELYVFELVSAALGLAPCVEPTSPCPP